MPLSIAGFNDIPFIVSLLNMGYRGEVSKLGWTTEADLLLGDKRTDEEDISRLMQAPGAIFLKYTELPDEKISGCVFLQKTEKRLYLGMLCVSPYVQTRGIGKQLLAAAEDFARQMQCDSIFMSVISKRYELIHWYERKGYRPTGETKPFPVSEKFGIPTQHLEFIILEKEISK
jgi:ribosomal protein S18 acetylase RimI-like enzyme